jgi:hypothetical protein
VFIDGAQSTSLSTSCAARTTVATLTTSFPAGDNIIIAPVQVRSIDAGNEVVDVRLYKSTTLLVQNEFLVQVGASGKSNHYTLLYRDVGAAASPTYTVEACTDATVTEAEAKMLAISGFSSTDFIDGSSTALGTGDTTLATKTTSFPAGNNVVLAMVTVDNGGTAQDIVAAGIRVKNNGGTEIASNQFAMSFGTAAPTDIQNIFLVAKDDSAPANAVYSVTGKSPNAANGEAKLLIFQPKSYAYVDGGSVGIGTTETELASISTSFPAFTDLAIVAGNEFDDSNAAVETISIGAFDLLSHSTTPRKIVDNQSILQADGASGSAGDGFRYGIISKVSTEIANPAPETDATASATGLNGESKIIAFEIANPISQVNCDACNPSPQPNVGCCIFVLAQLAQNYMKEPERIDR